MQQIHRPKTEEYEYFVYCLSLDKLKTSGQMNVKSIITTEKIISQLNQSQVHNINKDYRTQFIFSALGHTTYIEDCKLTSSTSSTKILA